MNANATAVGQLVFYDDARARTFQPFAHSRPMCEMRAGAMLTRERWEYATHANTVGFLSAPQLVHFEEPGAATSVSATIPRGTILVNARAIVALDHIDTNADVWMLDGEVAAVRVAADVTTANFAHGAISLEQFAPSTTSNEKRSNITGTWMNEVWDYIRFLTPTLVSDLPTLAKRLGCNNLDASPNGPVISGEHPVFIEEGAHVEPFTYFDTALGPVLLRQGSHVHAFTRVIGPCYVGRDSTVTADRISGSSIGDTCRVHGELSATIFIGHSNKGHDGFVGHSILGRWVNLGAGTITSNLKNTYGTVALWTPDGVRDTGMQFLGTMFGDHVKTGIGLRLTTGCVLGTGANVFDNMPPKAVAPFSWGSGAPYMLFDDTKFLETASRVMQRRKVELTDNARVYLRAVFDARWKTN